MTPDQRDAAIEQLDDQFKPLGWHVWTTGGAWVYATHIRTAAEMAELTRQFGGAPAGSGETIHANTPAGMRGLLEHLTAQGGVVSFLGRARQVWLSEARAARAQITAAQTRLDSANRELDAIDSQLAETRLNAAAALSEPTQTGAAA
jgi:hypothetical protein